MASTAPSRSTSSSFASRIREARLEAGLSQSELATRLKARTKTKINKALISQWELGRVNNPQMATVEAICTLLGYNYTWLTTGKGPKRSNLGEALDAHNQSKPLDRTAFSRAVFVVVEHGITDPDQAAHAALELYDALVESPATDDAILRRMVGLFKSR